MITVFLSFRLQYKDFFSNGVYGNGDFFEKKEPQNFAALIHNHL